MRVRRLLLLSAVLLSAWGTAAGPQSLTGLPPVADPGPCSPPRDTSARVGLQGYQRYFANDSLIGRPVPCTRDDKICFRHNLVFDPSIDRCQPLGEGRHFNCDLRPNRTEFEHGSGRLLGVCKPYEDPCTGYRMAYDGRCYRKEVVRDVLCGCEAKPTRHFLEGVECRGSPATPIHIQQPEDEGRCLIPDLRFPDIERSSFFNHSFAKIQGFDGFRTAISFKENTPLLKCNPDQAACFSEGKVFVAGYQGCHTLLEQGPCAKDHVVALDLRAAIQGRAEGTCVHVRGGCPKGYKRMVFDNECHEDREIQLEAPGDIVWNQYGQYILIPRIFRIWFHPKKVNSDTCKIDNSAIGGGAYYERFKAPCRQNNTGVCLDELYKVETRVPVPLD
ncbi:hypothetical protein R5R35_003990 [Gryllus longicercus]|uniref:Accessory gland protein n=1 Tax=Gryllus longicercus TaxID=2509291 RepID=A0AAN9Z5Z9_9ORTH